MKYINIHLKKREIKLLEKKKKERLSSRELNRVNILLLSHYKKQEKSIADFLGIERTALPGLLCMIYMLFSYEMSGLQLVSIGVWTGSARCFRTPVKHPQS